MELLQDTVIDCNKQHPSLQLFPPVCAISLIKYSQKSKQTASDYFIHSIKRSLPCVSVQMFHTIIIVITQAVNFVKGFLYQVSVNLYSVLEEVSAVSLAPKSFQPNLYVFLYYI